MIHNLNEIAFLQDDDEITVVYRVGDLRRAIEMGNGGPEIMSTTQAAKVFGWTAKRWRSWAEGNRIIGAWQEEDGRWRLPRKGCRELVEELRTRGGHYPPREARSPDRPAPRGAAPRRSGVSANINTPNKRSIRRGPRKAESR